jgi:RND family efflux transporter MFP subunit
MRIFSALAGSGCRRRWARFTTSMNFAGKRIDFSAAAIRRCPGLALASALLLAAAGTACDNAAKSAAPQGPGGVPVKIQVAESVPVSDTSEYVATLRSRDSAVVMPEVEGRITKIYVHSGQHVSPGTPLMQIDPSKQQATVTSQEHAQAAQVANLKWAQQQFERTNGLHSAGVVSQQDLDQAKAALDTAQSQLRSLDAQVQEQQVQLHYYRVLAPTTGIVGDVPVREGDRVTTTTQLTTVDKPGGLEVYIYVPIERSGQLKTGLPVQLVDGAGNTLSNTKITFVSPQVDTNTQTVLAKAVITNNDDRLRTLQFIRARVVWGTHNGPVVPVLAVSRLGGQYFAFVAEDQGGKMVAHQRPLQIGSIVGNNYEILDGIKPGDKVVVSGMQFLVDGAPVIPQA